MNDFNEINAQNDVTRYMLEALPENKEQKADSLHNALEESAKYAARQASALRWHAQRYDAIALRMQKK